MPVKTTFMTRLKSTTGFVLLAAASIAASMGGSSISGAMAGQKIQAGDPNAWRPSSVQSVTNIKPQLSTIPPVWRNLARRLIRDGMEGSMVCALFQRGDVRFDPRVMPRKLAHRESRLNYEKFLNPVRLNRARAYLQDNKALLDQVQRDYGVPKEIKVAILLIETDLGRYLGAGPAFNILASMAVASNFETVKQWIPKELLEGKEGERTRRLLRKKSRWAYGELKALIRYSQANRCDPLSIKGSIFGAIGLCQFMPTNALKFGVDYNHDGKVDLFSKADALASMANYLRHFGWKKGLSQDEQEQVILKYNYSRPYARTVLEVAKRI